MTSYLKEVLPELLPNGYWEVLTDDEWDELHETLWNDFSNEYSVRSENYPSFILESEAEQRVQNAHDNARNEIEQYKYELDRAEGYIRDLEYEINELRREINYGSW